MPTGARVRVAFALVLAALLLVLAVQWRIPLMLWDHLDLLPLYSAMLDGTLASSDLWKVHGGHLHTAAYAILLLTTRWSGGQTWLDCVVSWGLLLGYAAFVMHIVQSSLTSNATDRRSTLASWASLLIVFLALYPGHLSNLQWGWQVAVFLCLLGIAGTICLLTLPALKPWMIATALAFAAIATLSFAVGVALLPTALLLVLLRRDVPRRTRVAFALPWVLALLGAGLLFLRGDAASTALHPLDILLYVLNFLGAGVCRFANDVAPWLAAAAIASGVWAIHVLRAQRRSLPWIGFFVVVLISAVLVAFGRVASYGADQAFATRYVSFSSLFWIGWLGLMVNASAAAQFTPRRMRLEQFVLGALTAFAVVNAIHLTRKAAVVATHSRAVAEEIVTTYPAVPPALLKEIYFNQPDVALQRLALLHAWGFAPFQ